MLDLLRGLGNLQPTRDDGDSVLRQIIASTKLTQHNQRAQLDATATLDQLKTLFNTHDPTTEPAH